ncbi:MAG: tRNA (uridine(34)/cytosine(34)/5-carboxymethylaminomethyluridine(34)-2'-O)-methyltransferase TrmL [Zetaproteobacteria bacterium CG_4_9_14_3_um_filter_49_83]|nr:MAG: tRNA (uridine(34)/cytosine(34)/5-carboxymethylaminomethyluridine(34)-2'-O)-methyltransferase TrmL [Zetaproteobacteria bacterium CG1_02_49_23]PIQ30342.1 MAG: tRNA (uridine(34)/cytosine(34)/5-carboxymethylaminomethyluridine(34)-2'-O)-methyltransferase TrmL [Zetaproteobacteria bacterium CG17_big_fil_post_rev_8_21_14_2_50_50_13]PIV31391.1 MAG: tRNA (uridine(34)/cytosine(34)/5-carboxymethylaminomethyluridine(34)-2'-O)-methyltransferase TrmL [Zetaproteobacteria bacterium CG02_land_8_20_14_3_00_
MTVPLHIVLYQPEIPPNTGNIARLCACTGCALHLVHPLGFDVSDKAVRRAGLDYWQHLNVYEYADWQVFSEAFAKAHPTARWFALTTKASDTIWTADFHAGDALVFGPETRGLPEEIIASMRAIRIPMRSDAAVRSLNLSSACSIITYEALRQLNLDYL